MNQMNILALDIATKTGWAVSVNGMVSSGVLDMSKMPDYGQRGFHFSKWLADMIVENQIELMAAETTLSHGHSAYVLIGLGFTAQTVAYAHDIKRMTVSPSTLKKATTGHGRASKDDMMKVVKGWGFDPQDDNESDAIALLTYMLRK